VLVTRLAYHMKPAKQETVWTRHKGAVKEVQWCEVVKDNITAV